MGGRLVGAAVTGVLVLGGGVAAAGPASAMPVVPVVRAAGQVGTASAGATGPAAVRTARVGLRAHQITDHASSRRRHKARRSPAGRALDAVFGRFLFVALVVLLLVVLVVFAVRCRKGR
ncbi:hypothetical protein [Kitasatospora aureofaciens]|uniref:hypothetical protein n=1 Tax=Kitasatospora aureofaciens TaxID=1894 RepID=UPI001D264508|nr:hypothetical protein [Kitasatospora aureofaciens]HJD81027.1 hypothetical protein [Kitasatospora aureofaciens]